MKYTTVIPGPDDPMFSQTPQTFVPVERPGWAWEVDPTDDVKRASEQLDAKALIAKVKAKAKPAN